jgi:NADP-dependent 3-hydroxy acid dehydrogenase YdfG
MTDTRDVTLEGRTALVTGASRGIGAETARALARRGMRVALVARSEAPLNALATEIGGGAVARPCDVGDADAVRQLVERVARDFDGAPDILVNNAGVFALAQLDVMSATTFVDTIQTNLIAPFLLVRAFLPAMRARGSGDVVTVGSIADRMVMPENGAYSAAKYGARAMHEVLRLELRGTGVRATLVSPGATDTALWDPILAEPHERAVPTRDVMLAPSAVADAIAYAVTRPAGVNIDELRLSHS